MFILIGIVLIEAILLGITVWSTRRVPAKARARSPRRWDDLPHAL
jgi:hypothetical protein